jgi:hypothetical protein
MTNLIQQRKKFIDLGRTLRYHCQGWNKLYFQVRHSFIRSPSISLVILLRVNLSTFVRGRGVRFIRHVQNVMVSRVYNCNMYYPHFATLIQWQTKKESNDLCQKRDQISRHLRPSFFSSGRRRAARNESTRMESRHDRFNNCE